MDGGPPKSVLPGKSSDQKFGPPGDVFLFSGVRYTPPPRATVGLIWCLLWYQRDLTLGPG